MHKRIAVCACETRSSSGACLARKLQEGRHLVHKAWAKGLVQIKGDAQADKAILLVVCAQNAQAHTQQLRRKWLQRFIVRQPAQWAAELSSLHAGEGCRLQLTNAGGE